MRQRYCQKSILGIMIVLLNTLVLTTHGQIVEWAKSIGGSQQDRVFAIAHDASGNSYITGGFSGSVDFDPSSNDAILTSNGQEDIFLAKYGPDGEYLWAKSFGDTSNDQAWAIAVDQNGDVYIGGAHSSGAIDFDPGSDSAKVVSTGGGGFLAKYDNNGNYIWAKSFQGGSAAVSTTVMSIAFDPSNQVVINGHFWSFTGGSINFNPGGPMGSGDLTAIGIGNLFLAKYAGNGDYQWATNIGGNYINFSSDLTVDLSGNIYQTGFFGDTLKSYTGSALVHSNGQTDILLSKHDSTGSLVWAKGIGGVGGDEGASVAVTNTGYLYLTGGFRDTVNFNPATSQIPPLISNGGEDIFIAKYDTSGNYIWANSFGNSGNDEGVAICTDELDNIYVTGTFSDTVDFDPSGDTILLSGHNNGSQQNATVFIGKYDSSGAYVWAGASQGQTRAFPSDLSRSDLGVLHLTGTFSYRVDFDPWLDTSMVTSNGSNDIFMLKINTCGSGQVIAKVECDSFTFNGGTYLASGRYVDTFTNSVGCDSLILLDLTLGQSTINPVIEGTYCDSVSFNNISYSTSGIYTQPYTNFSGCDSNIIYDLTITKSTDTTIEVVSCDSFGFGDSTYTLSGVYRHIFVSAENCDSVVNLDLTIGSALDASIVKNGTTLIAASNTGEAQHYQWLDCDNGSLIPDEDDQEFTPSTTGNYAVIITSNGCSDTSDCNFIDVPGSSVNEMHIDNQLKLYPNPTSNKLNIETGCDIKEGSMRLINSFGMILMEKKHLSGRLFTLDMSTLTTGVYFIELSNGSSVIRRKLVKVMP